MLQLHHDMWNQTCSFDICHGLITSNDEQGYWLDRAIGGVCYTFLAKNFSIGCGDDPNDWEWLPHKMGSKFVNIKMQACSCGRDVCELLFVLQCPLDRKHEQLLIVKLEFQWHSF